MLRSDHFRKKLALSLSLGFCALTQNLFPLLAQESAISVARSGQPHAGLQNAKAQPARLDASGETTVAYVTLGSSTTPHHIDSKEILLDPLLEDKSPPVITAMAASHDGKFLAAAGDDHAIRIVDVLSGETLQTLVAHDDWIQSLEFSSDSQTLYSAGNDGRVLMWQHKVPARAVSLARLPYAVRSVSVSSQQGLLAIGGFSDQILVLDLANSTVKHRLQCECGDQRCVRFSPDGNQLLCGGRDGEVRVWNTADGSLVTHYHIHTGRTYMAAFSTDGTSITSVATDRTLVRYDLSTRSVVHQREIGPAKLMSMCMINDDLVAAAGADNSVHLYDAASNQVIAHLNGHIGTVAVMTPCGRYLASGSFDTTIRIWDLESIDADKLAAATRSTNEIPVKRTPIKMDRRLRIR